MIPWPWKNGKETADLKNTQLDSFGFEDVDDSTEVESLHRSVYRDVYDAGFDEENRPF